MNNLRWRGLALAAVAGAALAGCFGGGDDEVAAAPDNSMPPATAAASPQGFLDYIAAVPGLMIDGGEPVDLSAFTPPANDDTKEPAPTSIDA